MPGLAEKQADSFIDYLDKKIGRKSQELNEGETSFWAILKTEIAELETLKAISLKILNGDNIAN